LFAYSAVENNFAMNASVVANEAAAHRRRFPLFQGILPLDKSRLTPDILAGITLAALGIPEVMGYTKIIGTPVITGLYTMLLPMLAFAVFGSSRHLVVSADSATAAMVAAALTAMAFVANTPQYVALTGLVGLVAAAILLLARLLRLGFLADFLSRTVLVGFLSGVGIQVAFGELHGMLGLEKGGHGFFGQIVFLFRNLSETQLPCLYIALAVLAVIVVFEKLAPRFPGALLAVIGMIAASAYFHWADHGIQVVGEVPSGLPHLGLPEVTWDNVRLVLPISLSCFIVILAQSAATSRAYALRYRDEFDPNADLVGLSLANAAAGCSSTFLVNGSPTKTAMVDTAGGRSQVSHLATAAMVLLVLLFLTKPLALLPNAVLAAIVFLIGVKLFDHRGLAEISRKKPKEFALAVATAAVVVIVGVEQGILFALILSLLQFVRRSYQPHTAVILQDDRDRWRMAPAVPGEVIEPGLVFYWFGAELFFANAGHFTSEARRLAAGSPTPVKWLAIDASAITAVDFSAGKELKELQQDLAKQSVVLALARVSDSLQRDLNRLGLTRVIGADRIFDSRHACLEAYRQAAGRAST
jgi:sulfate permease, SulP family